MSQSSRKQQNEAELQEYIEGYVKELKVSINHFSSFLIEPEAGVEFFSLYDAIFRSLHSIKGNAMFLGIKSISQRVHDLESQMEELKTSNLGPNHDVLTTFNQSSVFMEDQLAKYEASIDSEIESNTNENTSGDDLGLGRAIEVLLVDDEPGILLMFEDFINDYFFANITMASNGREGVEHLDKKKFDIVITDFFMPEMNGQELIENIRLKDVPNQSTPVILITGYKPQFMPATEVWEKVFLMEKPYQESQLKFIFKCAMRL